MFLLAPLRSLGLIDLSRVAHFVIAVVVFGCQGMWVKGLRQGHGKMVWRRSGQTFEGEFYAGLRHGHGVSLSPATGVSFEGEFTKGQIRGHGTLVLTDLKTRKQRRVRRGLWHKSEFAPAGFLDVKDLVHIIDKAIREGGGDCL